MEHYVVPKAATFLHSFPHYDFQFMRIDATLKLEDQSYRECLLLWAAVPVLLMLLLLLLQLLYFCYRCCRQDVIEGNHTGKCLNWSLAILAIVSCGALVTGFFGIDEMKEGADRFTAAKNGFHKTIEQTRWQIDNMKDPKIKNVDNEMERQLNEYLTIQHRFNETTKAEIQVYFDRAAQATRELTNNLDQILYNSSRHEFSSLDAYLKDYVFHGWVAVMILLGSLIFLLLLLLLGIGRSSKPTLLLFCAFGIMSLVVCWICVGVHLSIGIAVGDFCTAPRGVFERTTTNRIIEDLDRYYSHCEEGIPNPYTHVLQSMAENARSAKSAHTSCAYILGRFRPGGGVMRVHSSAAFDNLFDPIISLAAFLECTNLNKNFADAVDGICYTSLIGIIMVTVSTAVAGFLFPILVVLASAAWRYLGQTKIKSYGASASYEERGVFLPRPEPSSPNYPSYSRSPQTMSRDQQSLSHRSMADDIQMAPPGYNTSVYYRQPPGGIPRGIHDASL